MFDFDRPLGFGSEYTELGNRVLGALREENWFGPEMASAEIADRARKAGAR